VLNGYYGLRNQFFSSRLAATQSAMSALLPWHILAAPRQVVMQALTAYTNASMK